MENQNVDTIEEKVRTLTKENVKLKKTNLWLSAFVVIVAIIQIYNFIDKWF